MASQTTDWIEHLYHKMIERHSDESHPDFPYYGGAGGLVDKRWLNGEAGFKRFCGDISVLPGRKSPRLAERAVLYCVVPSRGYCPGNVFIRSDVIEYQGIAHTRPEWARALGIPYGVLTTRLRRGW